MYVASHICITTYAYTYLLPTNPLGPLTPGSPASPFTPELRYGIA